MIDNLATGSALPLDLALNPVIVNIEAYEVAEISDRNSIDYYLHIYVHNGSSFEKAVTLEAKEEPVQTADGIHRYNGAFFDISGVLKGFLDPSFTLPQSGVVEQSGMTIQYYTKAEIFVNSELEETFVYPTRWAYYGGLSTMNFDYNANSFFSHFIGSTRKFLTYQPRACKLHPHLMDFLSWLNNYTDNSTEIYLNVWAYYRNGATTTTQPLSVKRPSAMAVYTFPIGITQLGIETENLIGFKVFLSNQASQRISEVMEYEYICDDTAKMVVFQNSLGVPATVVSTGLSYTKLSFQRDIAEIFPGFRNHISNQDKKVEKAVSTKQIALRLGLFYNDYKWLAEIGLSKRTFFLQENKWLPVIPIFDGIDLEDEQVWEKEFELLFEFSATDEVLSLATPAPSEVDRPTGWKPYRTACELDEFGKYTGKLKVLELVRYYLDTDEYVKPLEIKKNVSGTEGYIDLTDSAGCLSENTPFVNTEYSMKGKYRRLTCGPGLVGDYPTIIIPAGRWGSILSQGDANKKAEQEAKLLDTQAYANTYGPCNTVGVYDPGAIPSGRWWIRIGAFTGQSALSGFSADLNGSGYRPGNMWYQVEEYQPDQTDVYIYPRFDRHYPVLTSPRFYEFVAYHLQGKKLRFFRDGLLVNEYSITSEHVILPFPANPQNGEKWYIDYL